MVGPGGPSLILHSVAECLQEPGCLTLRCAAPLSAVLCLQLLLSVAGDGSICIVPMVQFTQAAGATHTFKQASGWSGYSQGRWADSHVFVTVCTSCCFQSRSISHCISCSISCANAVCAAARVLFKPMQLCSLPYPD